MSAGSATTPDDAASERGVDTYSYIKAINPPLKMNMSDEGSWSAIGRDLKGLLAYIQLLTAGGGPAQVDPSEPLGDRFTVKTIGKCKSGGESVDRSIFVNNIPDGSIPFIEGTEGTLPKGLIPGVMNNLSQMNPASIFGAFKEDTEPPCSEVNLLLKDNDGHYEKKAYIANSEIKKISPCVFASSVNPKTGQGCGESFANRRKRDISEMPEDPLIKTYYTSIGLLMLYILVKLMHKYR